MILNGGADVGNHIIQECAAGKAGTGLDFQRDLAGGAVNFLYKVTGVADGGYQIGNNVSGGPADQIGATVDDCQCVVVAGCDTGNGAGCVIFHGDLGVDAQNQNAAVCKRLYGCGFGGSCGDSGGDGGGGLTAGGEHQHQRQCACDNGKHLFHNPFSFYSDCLILK